MKSFYKFLFYKLYRFAIAEQKSVSINLNFTLLATVLEGLHIVLLGAPLKYFKVDLNFNEKLFPILFVIIGALFNYLFFFRNKRIEKINIHFQEQKRIIWKDDLLFFGYIIFLFIVMFVQVFIIKRIGKD